MNIDEYNIVKNYTYIEYCDYLQQKYGIGIADYFSPNWSLKSGKYGPSRTKEGLFCHHKYEDHAIMLCEKKWAQNNPYEWQKKENLVYCDYLEHLLLHILICQFPAKDKKPDNVGIGGVVNHLIPKLNDLFIFSGYAYLRQKGRLKDWENKCIERIVGSGRWGNYWWEDDNDIKEDDNPLWVESKKIFMDMKETVRKLLEDRGKKSSEIKDTFSKHNINVFRLRTEEMLEEERKKEQYNDKQ